MSRVQTLSALVGSRICHDLISPLGAIGNGIELMGLSENASSPEFSLIEESVQSANARIKFFRIAYGMAREDQNISRAEITSTLTASARGGRLSYHWDVEGDQPKSTVRLAFLLFQCLETAMPFGGHITVQDEGGQMVVTAEAERMKIEPELWENLTARRPHARVSAGHVQFALLPEVMSEGDRRLALQISQGRITARF